MTPGESYHHWYYSNNIWKQTTFLGVPCLKSVSDMWNYQEIIFNLKPSLVIEFGTWCGGSALFFSKLVPKVFTVDIEDEKIYEEIINHRKIDVMTTLTTDSDVAEYIINYRSEFPGPVFAILDSDHAKEHVLAEMISLRPLLTKGDYLVVEDGCINGHPLVTTEGPGPYEAIEEYFQRYPDDYTHDTEREKKFGFTFATNGFLIRN